jgi:hypothetical protein
MTCPLTYQTCDLQYLPYLSYSCHIYDSPINEIKKKKKNLKSEVHTPLLTQVLECPVLLATSDESFMSIFYLSLWVFLTKRND